MIYHHVTCRRADETKHRFPLSTGEVSVTEYCRSCGASHTYVVDRDDPDLDDDQPQPKRRGWPFVVDGGDAA